MGYDPTMEHYPAPERSKVLTRRTVWISLEITLSERSQTQRATYSMTAFTGKVPNRPTHRDRGGSVEWC